MRSESASCLSTSLLHALCRLPDRWGWLPAVLLPRRPRSLPQESSTAPQPPGRSEAQVPPGVQKSRGRVKGGKERRREIQYRS